MQKTDYSTYAQDMFCEEALQDPFPHYNRVRDLGPVVYFPANDFYVLSRFDDVKNALMAADQLISSQGNALNDMVNGAIKEEGSRPGVIVSDGDLHKRLRAPLVKALAPGTIKDSRDNLKAMISAQVASLVGGDTFDGVKSLAQHLPLAAISHLLGLPEEGRQNMLHWASSTFNALGPNLEKLMANFPHAMEGFQYIEDIDRASLREGSWAADMFALVDAGKVTEQEARALIGDFMIPSLDTTIFAKANLLYNLGTNPEEWAKLKAGPSLIRSAVFESVRHSAVVRWFPRHAVADYSAGDVSIPVGARVVILYGSANRDERQYPDPDAFKVDRNPRDQLGWSTGPHVCAGMHLAKLEMEVLLEALVEQVETIEVGETTYGTNQGLYRIDSLAVRLN